MKMEKHITCRLHNLDKCYFCMNEGCMKALCPDCFIEDHIGHKKTNFRTVFSEGKQKVSAAIEIIDEKIVQLKAKEESME